MFNVDSVTNKPSGNNMYNNTLVVIDVGNQRGVQLFYSSNTQTSWIRFWYYPSGVWTFTNWKQTSN